MIDRWRINKIGFVNFWLYDNEVFSFSHGKLLLRGTNGSGKSITTQSFIPFILDGDRTPSRLDPFGSNDRKMEYYFLGNGEKSDVTGYLFLEFKKESTNQYKTIGIGQRARTGKPMDFWGFIILDGKRIGIDINLFKKIGDENIPYSKRELKNELGINNPIVDTQREYMELVNKNIFGFPRQEQYIQFVNLLIKVRAPKLSRDFKPTDIYKILNDSLQTLSDEDLKAMVDTMEKMDEYQVKLEGLKVSFKDIRYIRNEYKNFNRFVIGKKAKAYLDSKNEVITLEKDLNNLGKYIENKNANILAKNDENELLQADNQKLLVEKNTLGIEDLKEHRNRLSILEKDIKIFKEKGNSLNGEITKHVEKIKNYNIDVETFKTKVEEHNYKVEKCIQKLEEVNINLEYVKHKNIVKAFEEDDLEILKELKVGLNDLNKLILNGLELLKELKECDTKCDESENELKKLQFQKSEIESEVNITQTMEESCRDALIEEFHKIKKEFKELKIDENSLNNIINNIINYKDSKDMPKIKSVVDNLKSIRESELLEKRAYYKSDYENLLKNYKKLHSELEELQNKKDPSPERENSILETRRFLKEKGIEFLPFYETIEFNSKLSVREKALIEKQLMDMGILDSLVVSKKNYHKIKGNLENHCDSLVIPNLNIQTGYSDLVPSEINESLKEVVFSIINNISTESNEESKIVLNPNGYYKNGVLEGYSIPNKEAFYIGKIARKNKLKQMIKEKQEECDFLKKEINETESQIKIVEDLIKVLNKEYNSLPSFSDLDEAISMVKEANFKYKKLLKEYEEKESTFIKLEQERKTIKRRTNDICRQLPYENRISSYKEAKEDLEEYKEIINEIESKISSLNLTKSKLNNSYDLIEKETEIFDTKDLQLKDLNSDITKYNNEKVVIEDILKNSKYIEKILRVKELEDILNKNEEQIKENSNFIARTEGELQAKNESLKDIKNSLQEKIKRRNILELYFKEELGLEFIISKDDKSLDECLKESLELIKESDEFKTLGEAITSLLASYQKHNSSLTGYGISLEECFENSILSDAIRKRQNIIFSIGGKKKSLEEMYIYLKNSIEERMLLIQDKDRKLFENILSDTLGRKLSNRIIESKVWISSMSNLMKEMDTSMGLNFSLDWKPCPPQGENELNIKELEKILSRDKNLLKTEDIKRVSNHFRSKIQNARQIAEDNDEDINYVDLVRDALDFRKWFEFKMYFYRENQSKKELTNSAFNRFSGGEKAMAMYIPMFAAVNSQYKKSDKKDYPRMIALDEAFAGMDDKNISSMFELVENLDFDYIINSQSLWGCYETIKSLKIVELSRPINSNIVLVNNHYWNGKRKIVEGLN